MVNAEIDNKVTKNFIIAIKTNKVCLHPSDTIPGLTFNPYSKDAASELEKIKTHRLNKNYISLIANLQIAQKYWQPLPGQWRKILNELWPDLLTIIWKASSLAPAIITAKDGSLALRCPNPNNLPNWFTKVLFDLGSPVPTTSVNNSNEPQIIEWDKACDFLRSYDGFVPRVKINYSKNSKPSTIIRINDAKSYTFLRLGAISQETIEKTINKYI